MEGRPTFSPVIDYSASGARRSVEDSLQRLGVESIDIVFVHDLSPISSERNGRSISKPPGREPWSSLRK